MESLINFLESRRPIVLASAKVKSINGDLCHVVLERGGKDIWNCAINAIIENEENKLLLYPSVGSLVLIALMGDESAVIVSVSDVEKVYFKQGKSEMIFDQGGFEFNRDGENLKKVLNDFQTNFGKLCDELAKVVVSVGVTPDVPAIQAIKQAVVETNKTALNKILK